MFVESLKKHRRLHGLDQHPELHLDQNIDLCIELQGLKAQQLPIYYVPLGFYSQ